MDVSLTPEFESWVSEKVARGMYGSAREVIEAGLRLLQERDEQQRQLEELKQEIAVGLEEADRGELEELDIEAIKAEGRHRLAQSRKAG